MGQPSQPGKEGKAGKKGKAGKGKTTKTGDGNAKGKAAQKTGGTVNAAAGRRGAAGRSVSVRGRVWCEYHVISDLETCKCAQVAAADKDQPGMTTRARARAKVS